MKPRDDRAALPRGRRRMPVPVWAAAVLLLMLYACVMSGSLRLGQPGLVGGGQQGETR